MFTYVLVSRTLRFVEVQKEAEQKGSEPAAISPQGSQLKRIIAKIIGSFSA